MLIKNAKTQPEVYYGLHMVEGLAEYADEETKESYRIFVNEETIKNMNSSFKGKPVYVDHVDKVDLDNIQVEADGYVFDSFYNKADGKHWVRFIVVSDRAKEAIRMGWTLSNAYRPTMFSGGGIWHGVQYDKEVTGGEYEHLAIVRHPRYQESMILTPEQFKEYNGEKEIEIARLANSADKEKPKMKLSAFKNERKKLENDVDGDTVLSINEGLKDKKGKPIKAEVSVETLVNSYAAIHNMHGYANGDHMVKVGEKEMSVNELVQTHIQQNDELDLLKEKKNADGEGEGEPGMDEKKELKDAVDEDDTIREGAKDVDSRGGDASVSNMEGVDAAVKEPADVKKNAIKEKNDKIKNAGRAGLSGSDAAKELRVELSSMQVARGKSRYGS